MQIIETIIICVLCFLLGAATVGWQNNKEMKERADDLSMCWADRDFVYGVAFPDGGKKYAIRNGGGGNGGGYSGVRSVQVGQQIHKAHRRGNAHKQKILAGAMQGDGFPDKANSGRTLGKADSQIGVYLDSAIHSEGE